MEDVDWAGELGGLVLLGYSRLVVGGNEGGIGLEDEFGYGSGIYRQLREYLMDVE